MAPEFTGDITNQDDKDKYTLLLNKIALQLKEFIPSNTICVRFDPPVDFTNLQQRDDFASSFNQNAKKLNCNIKKSPTAVQPPDTTILDLTKSEDELMTGMKNKWRYNVRLAAKKGVEVKCFTQNQEGFSEAFEEFFKLFEITSKRDGVNFHGKDYYIDLLTKSAEYQKTDKNSPLVKLYIAKHENDYLAGIITLFCEREAVYLYGASGNVKRNLMAAYLLQWTAIQDAKKYGCPCYDFYGMPPTNDENHPMHGLYLFKTGFGGAIIHRPGSYDAILNNHNYNLYIKAEKLRAFWFRKVVKKLKGR